MDPKGKQRLLFEANSQKKSEVDNANASGSQDRKKKYKKRAVKLPLWEAVVSRGGLEEGK